MPLSFDAEKAIGFSFAVLTTMVMSMSVEMGPLESEFSDAKAAALTRMVLAYLCFDDRSAPRKPRSRRETART